MKLACMKHATYNPCIMSLESRQTQTRVGLEAGESSTRSELRGLK